MMMESRSARWVLRMPGLVYLLFNSTRIDHLSLATGRVIPSGTGLVVFKSLVHSLSTASRTRRYALRTSQLDQVS